MSDRNDFLIRQAEALPEVIEPGRDLWPGIMARLTTNTQPASTGRQRLWPVALAAGLAVAIVSSGLTWLLVAGPDVSPSRIVELMTEPAHPYVQDIELINARRVLTDSLDRSLMRLSPRTRRQVSMNLLDIHESMAEIRVALEQDPDNIFLHQLLYSTYQQEIGLLSKINRVAVKLPDEVET